MKDKKSVSGQLGENKQTTQTPQTWISQYPYGVSDDAVPLGGAHINPAGTKTLSEVYPQGISDNVGLY